MKYQDWLAEVPATITNDALWQTEVYRVAFFLGELAWYDVSKLYRDHRTLSLSDQLYRSTGSISANISEGYSRASGKDQARFYEYALGSAREARDWYFKGRHILSTEVTTHRLNLLAQIIRSLLKMIPKYRGSYLKEEGIDYEIVPPLSHLLTEVPMPIPDAPRTTYHAPGDNS